MDTVTLGARLANPASAPRVPAGPHSLASKSKRSPFRRLLLAIEPWYDWGIVNITNMDAATYADEINGEVRYFDLQWFGLHLGFQFGRTPNREG